MSRQINGSRSGRAKGGTPPPPDDGALSPGIAALPPGPPRSPPVRGRPGPDAARLAGALSKGGALPAAKRKPVDYSPDTANGGLRAGKAAMPAPSAAIEVVDLDYNPFMVPARHDGSADADALGTNPFVTPPGPAPLQPSDGAPTANPMRMPSPRSAETLSPDRHTLNTALSGGPTAAAAPASPPSATSGAPGSTQELLRSGSRGRLLRARSDLASSLASVSSVGSARSLENPRPPLRSLRSGTAGLHGSGDLTAAAATATATPATLPPRPAAASPERGVGGRRSVTPPRGSPFAASQLDFGGGGAGGGTMPAGRGLRGRLLSSRRSSVEAATDLDMVTPYRRVRRA